MRSIASIAAVFLCANALAQSSSSWIQQGDAAAAADRHAAAIAAYERAIAADPTLRRDILPKLGRQYLWADRPAKAAMLFEEYLGSKPDDCEIRNDYALALAWTNDRRAAEKIYREVMVRCDAQRDAARLRLGGLVSTDRLQIEPRADAFEDADGTRFRQEALTLSRGLWDGNGGIAAGTFELRDARTSIDARWLELRADHRFTPAHAIRASVRRTAMTSLDWHPFSGEVDFIYTPHDRLRADFSAARLLLDDNVAAAENRLRGDFLSAGTDLRASLLTTITAAADRTRWSAGNTRWRIRTNVIRTFETTPRITVEWPSLLQTYDRPFPFALFSPRRYFETGPAMNVRWKSGAWVTTLYGRAGGQRESAEPWKALGILRLTAERDLGEAWSLRGAAGWSNSNLAGSGGFRRTSASIAAVRRF